MSLLSFLFGGGNKPQPALTPPHQWGTSQDGYLTPQLNGGGQPQMPPHQPGALVQQAAQQAPASPLLAAATNPQAAPQGAPQGAPQQDPNAPINVTGKDPDTWQPHHVGILGQIADYLLDTHIGRGVHRKNMEEALQHINSNPNEAVKRLVKFDPEAAEALWDKVTDNNRQQGNLDRQNRIYDGMNENIVFQRMASAMSGANEQTWGPMREQMLKMAQARGVDVSAMIPEQYDPTSIKTMQYGAIPMAKQVDQSERARNHDMQHHDRLDSTAERRDFHSQEIPIMSRNSNTQAGRAGEQVTHDRNMEALTRENTDLKRQAQAQSKNAPREIRMTKYGPLEVSPDKKVGLLRTHGGDTYRYVSPDGGNTWVPTHQVAPSTKPKKKG